MNLPPPPTAEYIITGELLNPILRRTPSGKEFSIPNDRQPCMQVVRELLADCLYGHASISDIRSETQEGIYTVIAVLNAQTWHEITRVNSALRRYYHNLSIKFRFIKDTIPEL